MQVAVERLLGEGAVGLLAERDVLGPRALGVPAGPRGDREVEAVQDPEGTRLTGTTATFTREQIENWASTVSDRPGRYDWAICPAASTTKARSSPPRMPCTRPSLPGLWWMLAELKPAPTASAATAWPASCQAVCTVAFRAGIRLG